MTNEKKRKCYDAGKSGWNLKTGPFPPEYDELGKEKTEAKSYWVDGYQGRPFI